MPIQVAPYRARARSTLKRRRIEKRSPGASRAHTAAHTGSVWPHNTSATRGAAHNCRDQRGAILKGEAGIGGPKRADLALDKAAEEFLAWSKASKRLRTQRTYGQCIARLKLLFDGKRLSEISAVDLERYNRDRVDAGVTVMVNRELACLKTLYNRCREWGKYEGDHPAARVRQLRESPG